MTDEPDGGAADPSLKLERVGCPAPVCGAVFEIPVGRLGKASEIARGVSFLCSDHAEFVTGSTMSINGGQHMY